MGVMTGFAKKNYLGQYKASHVHGLRQIDCPKFNIVFFSECVVKPIRTDMKLQPD